MVFRVLAGFLAFWIYLGAFAGFYFGEYRHVGGGLLLGGLFLTYAIGGNKLINSTFSILEEQKSRWMSKVISVWDREN